MEASVACNSPLDSIQEVVDSARDSENTQETNPSCSIDLTSSSSLSSPDIFVILEEESEIDVQDSIPNQTSGDIIVEATVTDAEAEESSIEQESGDSEDEKKNLQLSDFNIGVTLGTGSFGRVKVAIHKKSSNVYAIKMLKKSAVIKLHQVEHMLSERHILSSLDHPFIVKLSGSFQDDKYLYMVLEYVVGGEFFTHLRKAGKFIASTCIFYSAQIVLAFEYLHASDYIYRDLKPENLLLDKNGYLKITDFGFAKKVPFKTYTLCGTPEYIAPEVLLNKGHGKGVDWWTLGILLYEMMTGQPPFVDDDPMGIYQRILAGRIVFPRYFDRKVKSLVKKLLVADLIKRYGCLKDGAGSVKSHKLYSGFDWTSLLERSIVAPIVPVLSTSSTSTRAINCNSDVDTSNFDEYPEDEKETETTSYPNSDHLFVEFG